MISRQDDWCLIIDGVVCCDKLFMILLIENMDLSHTGVLKENNWRKTHAKFF